MKTCIGLFGTCGSSIWRKAFMREYDRLDITYFNPQVDDWKPELAKVEAEHLASDAIIVSPVTNETYATGSLAETGFSILNAIRLEARRDFVVMIDSTLKPELMENLVMAKESIRARALVTEHLKKCPYDNIHFVSTLDDMLKVSLVLWDILLRKEQVKRMTVEV